MIGEALRKIVGEMNHIDCDSAVIACDQFGTIGVTDTVMDILPWRIPSDMAHFKTLTMGQIVVMGSATFRSLPSKLMGRINIVLTRRKISVVESIEKDETLNELLTELYLGALSVINSSKGSGCEYFSNSVIWCNVAQLPYVVRLIRHFEPSLKTIVIGGSTIYKIMDCPEVHLTRVVDASAKFMNGAAEYKMRDGACDARRCTDSANFLIGRSRANGEPKFNIEKARPIKVGFVDNGNRIELCGVKYSVDEVSCVNTDVDNITYQFTQLQNLNFDEESRKKRNLEYDRIFGTWFREMGWN